MLRWNNITGRTAARPLLPILLLLLLLLRQFFFLFCLLLGSPNLLAQYRNYLKFAYKLYQIGTITFVINKWTGNVMTTAISVVIQVISVFLCSSRASTYLTNKIAQPVMYLIKSIFSFMLKMIEVVFKYCKTYVNVKFFYCWIRKTI